MSSIASTRLDDDLKRDADALFADLGLTMSSALTMFVRQAVREQGIPFKVTRRPNAATLAALSEAQSVAHDPSVKAYDDLGELFTDLRA